MMTINQAQKFTSVWLLLLAICTGNVFAQAKGDRPMGKERKHFSQLRGKLDTDGDGQVSEVERRMSRKRADKRWGEKGKQNYQKMIQRLDKDGDGKLSREERAASHEIMRKYALDNFDKDGDGQLSDAEKLEARIQWNKQRSERRPERDGLGERVKGAKQRFVAKFDTDGDGKLSLDEKRLAGDSMRRQHEEFKGKMLQQYDADGDGELSWEERKRAHEAEKSQMLDKFDTDKDGVLNREEKGRAFDHMIEHTPFRLMHELMHHQHGERRLNNSKPPRGGGQRPQR